MPEFIIGFNTIECSSRLQQANLCQDLKLFAMLVKVNQLIILVRRVFQSAVNHHEIGQEGTEIWHGSLDGRACQLVEKQTMPTTNYIIDIYAITQC